MTYTNEWNLVTPLTALSEEERRRVEYRIEHVLMNTEIDSLVTIKASNKLLAEIMKALLPSWEPKEER